MPRALSRRNVRGRGCQKRGYRRNGYLSFQLRRSYASFSRQHEANENATISDLIQNLYWDVSNEDPGLPSYLHYEFFVKRNLLVPPDDMVKSILDGGETVYAKAFDDNHNEYTYGPCEPWGPADWAPKPSRRRRVD